MYECPASIAPEPNNYISSRSVFFSSLVSRTEDSFQPCQRFSRCHSPTWKSSDTVKRGKKPSIPGSPCFSGLSDCCIYLQRRLRSVSPACAPHCVSIQPQKRKADGSPSPSRRPLAGDQNRKLAQPIRSRKNSSALQRNQSEQGKGGSDTGLQIQLKHFLVVFSSDSEPVPMVTALFQL